MNDRANWEFRTCWVASFDILGFKNLVNVDGDTFEAIRIQEDYEETLNHLQETIADYRFGDIDYCWLSDTFIIFTPDDSGHSYTIIQQAAKRFIEGCLHSCVPVRGAVSVGSFIKSKDGRSIMGRAFIDAFVYGEDQDWLGLLLTPDAIARVRALGAEPARHDFIASDEIPMRKCAGNQVMAYRFQNGSANFKSTLLPMLVQMRQRAGIDHYRKYDRTICFIEKHYRLISPSIS